MQTSYPNLIEKSKLLPSNWAKLLAEKHGLHDHTIRQMIKGERTGPKYTEVITSFLDFIESHQRLLAEIKERAEKI